MTTVRVGLSGRGYDVHVGRALLPRVTEILRVLEATRTTRRALVVTQAPVAAHHLAPVVAGLGDAGVSVEVVEVADGEDAKTPAQLQQLWEHAAATGLTRSDLVVALGGGTVGDLAGFLAATWHRGTPVLQLPTTLLAQVDAAIGGKTAVNLAAGKNLVGAFHQPVAVVCDVDVLTTLEPRVAVEGLAEVVKAGLLADPDLLALLEADGADADPVEVVARAARVKADVVAGDEREAGARAHLNLGHTVGHALETLGRHRALLHGEAVAIGTVVALRLGHALGRTPEVVVERTIGLLDGLGLPTRVPPHDRAALHQVLARDKKARTDVAAGEWGVVFVVLDDLCAPALARPSRAQLDAVLDDLVDASLQPLGPAVIGSPS